MIKDGGAADDDLADRPVDVAIAAPEVLAKGFRHYLRHRAAWPSGEVQTRDLVAGGGVAAVLAVDIDRDEVVLIRQFRLAAHLANGRGDMVEIVAGLIEPGETAAEAARRECAEEIGVAPTRLIELFTFLPTPGITDERITLFVAAVEAGGVPARAGAPDEREETRPLRVAITEAIAGIDHGRMEFGALIIALQWLALNRTRLRDLLAIG